EPRPASGAPAKTNNDCQIKFELLQLQCTDRRRRRAPSDRGPRGDQSGYDRHQLAPMAFKAQQATGCEQITALADRGYFNGDQVLSCEGTGVSPIVPKTLTSSGAKRGLFTRQDFIYDAKHDHYTCPAGAKLTKIHRRADHTEDFDRYRHL